eukprot:Awhi_evm1s14393
MPDNATKDGFDVQMQTNHLSHFLLLKELFSLVEKAGEIKGESRVCFHSSIVRVTPPFNLDLQFFQKNGGNLGGDGTWQRYERYHQTKLANASCCYALADKLAAKRDSKVKSLLAHPGYAATKLQASAATNGDLMSYMSSVYNVAQSPEDGALGILKCAVEPTATNGTFYGPYAYFLGMATYGDAVELSRDHELLADSALNKDLVWSASEK